VPAEEFLVSAVIPAYNESVRIVAAIESAKRQTEPPAEILVIDDGSSDGTADVAASLGARVIVQPNAGVARTRNRLLREARYPWFAFLDADDVWYPGKLAAVRAAHAKRPDVDFIISDLRCTYENGDVAKTSVFATTPNYGRLPKEDLGDGVVLLGRSDLGRVLAEANWIGTSTVVARRDRLVERELFFDDGLRADADTWEAEDVEWYLRVLRTTDVLAISEILGDYCWRSASLSSNYGRVRYGDAKLGERVASNPAAYVDGAAAAFRAARRGQLRHAARIYARARNFTRARAILCEAQRDGFDVVDGAAIFLAGLAETAPGRALADALLRIA
jgi:glycosyltransferase involved in cell wall biosynthesis